MPYTTKQRRAVLQCLENRASDALNCAGQAVRWALPLSTASWSSWSPPDSSTASRPGRVRCTNTAPIRRRPTAVFCCGVSAAAG